MFYLGFSLVDGVVGVFGVCIDFCSAQARGVYAHDRSEIGTKGSSVSVREMTDFDIMNAHELNKDK